MKLNHIRSVNAVVGICAQGADDLGITQHAGIRRCGNPGKLLSQNGGGA